MFQSAFLPQAVTIELGDTVRWVWKKGTHTVTSGLPDGEPGSPDFPGAIFDAVVDQDHPEFSFTFDTPGIEGIAFFDRQSPSQVGFVEISSGEAVFRVGVVDNVFLPKEVFIFQGDTVLWEHEPNEDLHTVTSGLSSRPEDNPGLLFDAESSDQRPIFTHAFQDPGIVPYFCIPHEQMGMKGTVHVQRFFVRGDTGGDGQVDLSDAVRTLGVLFLGTPPPACLDAMDSNDDGKLELTDAVYTLGFLFLGGPPLLPPFPRPGPDRTEDELLCLEGDGRR